MIAFLSRLFGGRSDEPAWIETAELQRRLTGRDVLLVDVRQPEEFASRPGHLPGAIKVPLGDLAARTTELAARRQPIVLVCKTDRRSARAAAELLAAGLRDVAVLRGGTDGWHARGPRIGMMREQSGERGVRVLPCQCICCAGIR